MAYYLDEPYPTMDSSDWTFADQRKLIVLSRLNGDDSASVHSQMLSDLVKMEAEGKPVPAYAWHLQTVERDLGLRS